MSSLLKCKCGCTEIDTSSNPTCTACGIVLEDQLIVSDVTYDEGPAGNVIVHGSFVANDSTGGASGINGGYLMGGRESRELTIEKAKRGIRHICRKLQMTQHETDVAINYYKTALSNHLTRGRKQELNHAACVYMTCRTERKEHLLIDISDVLGICVHELGRTYLKFTRALCINPPSMDCCLFINRFAAKMELGDKKNKVAATAMRILKRMKKDNIHSGRRPSGLCGAALLMAARLHEFNRSANDIIRIVKIHESTLRKRLLEFGETPSSALTLDEFMAIDLDEEQDPPAFKASRKKDRERLQKLSSEDINREISELQSEIERELEKSKTTKSRKKSLSIEESADRFVKEQNLNVVGEIVINDIDDSIIGIDNEPEKVLETGLGPDIASMGLIGPFNRDNSNKDSSNFPSENLDGEIDITDIDDAELDGYIMSEKEAEFKSTLWHKINEKYLKEQQEKEEQRQRDIEEGKPEKKRRRTTNKKKNQTAANSAGEAMEKMLLEKKISTKINYEVLKNLNNEVIAAVEQKQTHGDVEFVTPETNMSPKKGTPKIIDNKIVPNIRIPSRKRKASSSSDECTPFTPSNGSIIPAPGTPEKEIVEEDEAGDFSYDEAEDEADGEEMGINQLLQQNCAGGDDDDDYGYGNDDGSDYEEYD